MRVLLQRVKYARVRVDGKVVAEIGHGLLLLVGIIDDDNEQTLAWMAKKCAQLRVFTDAEGKMNDSVVDVGGHVLVVSQFTLYGNTKKGNRPSFVGAGKPEHAKTCCERFARMLEDHVPGVQSGIFGADMKVELLNDGPVTLWLER